MEDELLLHEQGLDFMNGVGSEWEIWKFVLRI